jgi:hypothetical protein
VAQRYSSGFDHLHVEKVASDDVGPCQFCLQYTNVVYLLHWEGQKRSAVLWLCSHCIRNLHLMLHSTGEVGPDGRCSDQS